MCILGDTTFKTTRSKTISTQFKQNNESNIIQIRDKQIISYSKVGNDMSIFPLFMFTLSE